MRVRILGMAAILLLATFVVDCGRRPPTDNLGPPSAPRELVGWPVMGNDTHLTWLTDDDVDFYWVYFRYDSSQWILLDSVDSEPSSKYVVSRQASSPGPPGVGGTQCKDVRIQIPDYAYGWCAYQVTAWRAGLESDPSNTISAHLSDIDSQLPQFNIVRPPLNADSVDSVPTFEWDDSVEPDSWVIHVNIPHGNEWLYRTDTNVVVFGEDAGLTYVAPDSSQIPPGTYLWDVYAINQNGFGVATGGGQFSVE